MLGTNDRATAHGIHFEEPTLNLFSACDEQGKRRFAV